MEREFWHSSKNFNARDIGMRLRKFGDGFYKYKEQQRLQNLHRKKPSHQSICRRLGLLAFRLYSDCFL